ncbi:unnamed protein product [Coccothraustes coccothraustes]
METHHARRHDRRHGGGAAPSRVTAAPSPALVLPRTRVLATSRMEIKDGPIPSAGRSRPRQVPAGPFVPFTSTGFRGEGPGRQRGERAPLQVIRRNVGSARVPRVGVSSEPNTVLPPYRCTHSPTRPIFLFPRVAASVPTRDWHAWGA